MQKTLTNGTANCLDMNVKHNWGLIDSTQYYYIFKCENCKVTKKESIMFYDRSKREN